MSPLILNFATLIFLSHYLTKLRTSCQVKTNCSLYSFSYSVFLLNMILARILVIGLVLFIICFYQVMAWRSTSASRRWRRVGLPPIHSLSTPKHRITTFITATSCQLFNVIFWMDPFKIIARSFLIQQCLKNISVVATYVWVNLETLKMKRIPDIWLLNMT